MRDIFFLIIPCFDGHMFVHRGGENVTTRSLEKALSDTESVTP